MDDKTQLLRSLAIERPQQAKSSAPRGRRLMPAIAIAVLVVLPGISAALWFGFASPPARAPAVEVASTQPPQPESAQQKTPAVETRQAGSLIASGYVVARRKAT